jgi:hypothetical protein
MFISAPFQTSPTRALLPSAFLRYFGAIAVAAVATAQSSNYGLESIDGLRLYNVAAEPALLQGKRGVRVTTPADTLRDVQSKLQRMTPSELAAFQFDQLAVITDVQFSNGTIEAEIAGVPAAGAGGGARGFVGIAFRLRDDMRTYDAFYLRPTNGRAEDQERRNRSAQYISHPGWPWSRLRNEAPCRYETYVDLVPGEWTRIRIEVKVDRARLYVHNQAQPTLIVNDVKSGAEGKGGVALWIGPGAIGYFRNLTVLCGRSNNQR